MVEDGDQKQNWISILHSSWICGGLETAACNRYVLFTIKQHKDGSVEIFEKSEEKSENCMLREKKDKIIKNMFIVNLYFFETQRKLLNEALIRIGL